MKKVCWNEANFIPLPTPTFKAAAITVFVVGLLLASGGIISLLGHQATLSSAFRFLPFEGSVAFVTGGGVLLLPAIIIAVKRFTKRYLFQQAQSVEIPLQEIPKYTVRPLIQKPIPSYSQANSDFEQRQEVFKQQALARLAEKSYQFQEAVGLTDPQKEAVKQIITPQRRTISADIKVGGDHRIYFIEEINHVVFKAPLNCFRKSAKEQCEEAVAFTQKAREICQEHSLFLLYIPYAFVHQINPTTFVIVQERMEITGNPSFQDGIYYFCWEDDDLQQYIRELLKQLAIFICEMNLADVKGANAPFRINGLAALLDLDQSGAVLGLTKGCVGHSTQGLFRWIPSKWLDFFLETVREKLGKEFSKLEKELDTLRYKIKKRENKRNLKKEFLLKRGVTALNQMPLLPIEKFSQLSDQQNEIVTEILKLYEEKVEKSLSFDLVTGRTQTIDVDLGINSVLFEDYTTALMTLKKEGYLDTFKVKRQNTFLSIKLFL